MGFIRHETKECKIKTDPKAGSFSCIRLFLAGCSPAEPVSASPDKTKLYKYFQLENENKRNNVFLIFNPKSDNLY